jgi:hypothetical protein
MAAPAKFLFDMDFAAPDKTRAPAITPAEIAEKVAHAEAQAYRAGFDAAQREAKAESDRFHRFPRGSPPSRQKWRPKPSMSRCRWRANSAAN